MSDDVAIRVEHVNKVFKLPHEKAGSIKGALINFRHHKKGFERQHVLNNVSFEVKRGEFFGVVGRNGSGKSTLLKLLAGIYTPNSGTIQVNGKLTPFIELGVGFNPELTGRENVFLNGALLGFNRSEMEAMYDEIVEFAEIPRFMDQKLKNYSSGMQVRLAFSIAIKAKSDILLIDEVLAVGDALFQQKCYDYFQQLKDSDRTVIFISHDMGAVESFCDRAILINDSELIKEGAPQEVVYEYSELLSSQAEKTKHLIKDELQHIGVGGVQVTKGEVRNAKGRVTERLAEGEAFSVRIYYTTTKPIEDPVVGIGIMGTNGESIIGPNTREGKFKCGVLSGKGFVEAKFSSSPLAAGTYRLRGGIMNNSVTIPYDFVEKLLTFTVVGPKRYGDIYLAPEWKVEQ